MTRPVCCILGPTAGGKSALAHDVAKRVGGVVLAVDSMTVYRGMDVGTAKATAIERAEVPYRGLDLAEPTETFTVARWLAEADDAVAGQRPVVAVGGTPLYWQSLFRGLFEGPPADAEYRHELAGWEERELQRRLAEVDPAAAARIHRNDRKRLVRALEVFHLTGRPISELQRQWDAGPDRIESVRFGLSWDRPILNRRINARTKAMIEAGWLEEVRDLLDRYGELGPAAGEAAGYRLLSKVVRGQMKLDDAVEQIKISTRQLAKRQMTWFRRFERVTWLAGDLSVVENADRVLAAWR